MKEGGTRAPAPSYRSDGEVACMMKNECEDHCMMVKCKGGRGYAGEVEKRNGRVGD